MATFEITAPDGKKYRVTGENAEGAFQALQGHLGGAQEQPKPHSDGLSQARTGLGGFIEGIPIAGPFLRRGAEMAAAGTMAPFSDLSYSEILAKIDETNAGEKAANPVIDVGSQLAGSVTGTGLAAGSAVGKTLLGMGGKSLVSRMAQSGASGLGIAAADQAARDFAKDGSVSPENIVGAGAIGGTLGAAIPGVGYVGRKALGGVAEKAGDLYRSVTNPTMQAGRKVGQAIELDRAGGLNALSQADIAAAKVNGQPLMNADLGGETTRALTRAAANQSPEARGVIERTVQDRFATQAARLSDKVKNIAGNADDLGTIEQIKRAASASNTPAYRKAFTDPRAQALYTPRLQELMQAPAIRAAVKSVPKRSANRGAVEGFKEIKNPFEVNSQGSYVLRRKADGSMIAPNLQFWDQVKRNLDSQISKAQRAGDRTLTADLTGLKNALVNELDNTVGSYKAARQGAASFFGAEDAVEAGKKFFRSQRMLPEFRQGILKMTPTEREAFKVGFASEILDAAAATNDSQNVINRYFNSPEAREKIVQAFGKPKAQEFEAFVRIENAMDMLRGALGNSTTARQLIESGIGGAGLGGATWWYTGDLNSGVAAAAVGAAGRFGAKAAGKKINENVMKQTAELLLSNDTQAIQRAIQMAARSPQHMAAVDAISQMLGITARGAAVQASTE